MTAPKCTGAMCGVAQRACQKPQLRSPNPTSSYAAYSAEAMWINAPVRSRCATARRRRHDGQIEHPAVDAVLTDRLERDHPPLGGIDRMPQRHEIHAEPEGKHVPPALQRLFVGSSAIDQAARLAETIARLDPVRAEIRVEIADADLDACGAATFLDLIVDDGEPVGLQPDRAGLGRLPFCGRSCAANETNHPRS
ncbi:hypothetical protein [Bradyrhizobium sp. BR 1433]|uniref:hypothetical protein n=1 Tax=Bradyrhizobium sp. BR 1433 TaxID=3447967 RepID=UPI003EE75CC8